MKVLIAAAGTGGHINPGLAIANKIKQENPEVQITFVGTTRGLENDLVPRAGYCLKTIEVYGISRKISLENIKKMVKTLKGFGQAKKLMKEIKPDIVIGTGGYICGPTCLTAVKQNIPTILHESNAFPGVTVKMLSSKVNKVLVGFEDAVKRLPKAKKVIVTGNPTKIKNLCYTEEDKKKKKKEQGLDEKLPLVLVFGGSQGARPINEAMLDIIENRKNKGYSILWAAGPKQYDGIKQELEDQKMPIDLLPDVKILPYIYQMEEILNVADLVICRSGAMTTTEIGVVGKPAIFIPLPFATENHQEYNANVLAKQGAAEIIHDTELKGEYFANKIEELIHNQALLKQMGQKAKSIAIKGVEDKIYEEIVGVLKKK